MTGSRLQRKNRGKKRVCLKCLGAAGMDRWSGCGTGVCDLCGRVSTVASIGREKYEVLR